MLTDALLLLAGLVLLIGLTVVGMGTSMPELASSLQASLVGSRGIDPPPLSGPC